MSDNTPRDDFSDLNRAQEPAASESAPPKPAEEPQGFDFDGVLEEAPAAPASGEDQVDALTAALRRRQEQELKRAQQEQVDALATAMKRRAKPVEAPEPEPAEEAAPEPEPEAGKPGLIFTARKPAKTSAGDAERQQGKKQVLSPWEKRQKEMSVRRRAADITVGRELRPDEMLVYDSELDDIDYTDEEDLPEMRDYMPVRFRRYGRLGIAGGVMYALFVISVSVILASVAWLFASDVLALNKEPVSSIVTIDEYNPTGDDPVVNEEGDTITVDIDQVARALKNAGMIEYEWLFKLYSQFSHADTKIDPGTYDISTDLDYRAIVTALQFGSGNQEVTRITFPEGYSLEQVFALLEENHICRVTDLYESMENSDFDFTFLEDIPSNVDDKLEGYLFPDTYDFYQGESADVAIRRFLRNLNSKFTESMRVTAANRGLTVHDVLTIASLIEKEAGSAEEMPTIASVIYNRLNSGMNLRIDATINYIMGTSTLNVTVADTEIDDPYNTYLYEGLPPGPICNPGMAAIEAALNPETTDYWYWYAYEGENHFFTNFDDQQAFVAAHPIPGEGGEEAAEESAEEPEPAEDAEDVTAGEDIPAVESTETEIG